MNSDKRNREIETAGTFRKKGGPDFSLGPESCDGSAYWHVTESIDPSSLNLKSFKPKKELNPKLWVKGRLNSKVRLRLLDIADDFIDTLEVDWVEPDDIILTGSLAGYNWSRFSDIDLHIVMDFKKVNGRTEFVKDYFDSKKKIWNDSHEDLKVYGFPVELYVQDKSEEHVADGVYSLEKDKWIKEPEERKEGVSYNENHIKKVCAKIMDKIEALEEKFDSGLDSYETEALGKKVTALFAKIRGMRKDGLKSDGIMSDGNLIFKVLRRTGHLDRLYDLKLKTYDRMNSID